MITTGSKLWFAVTGLAVVALAAYGIASDWEKAGTYALAALLVAAMVLGITTLLARDGEVEARTEPAEAAETADLVVTPPTPSSVWPVAAAFGAAVTIVGLAGGNALFYVGLGVLAVVLVEWMVQGWSERATGDPAYNRQLRNQVMFPFEVPLAGAIVIAIVVISFSRVLLAVSKTGSVVIAIVVASAVLAVATLLSSRPRVSPSVLTGILVVGALAVLGSGVVGAVVGERHFEQHEVHGEEEQHEGDGVEADDRNELDPAGSQDTQGPDEDAEAEPGDDEEEPGEEGSTVDDDTADENESESGDDQDAGADE